MSDSILLAPQVRDGSATVDLVVTGIGQLCTVHSPALDEAPDAKELRVVQPPAADGSWTPPGAGASAWTRPPTAMVPVRTTLPVFSATV